jgi:tight adherence protein B
VTPSPAPEALLLAMAANRPTIFGMAFAAVLLLVLGLRGPIRRWMDRRYARMVETNKRLFLPNPPRWAAAKGPVIGLSIFFVVSMLGLWILALIGALFAWYLVDAAGSLALRRRAKRFDAQFVDALIGLSNSLKAGMSLPQSVEQVSKDMPPPVSEEFGHILSEYNLGKPIEVAFADASERLGSRNFDLAVLAFKAGKERGGNVAEVFEKIAASIREIWRLEEHIDTVATEGKSSARFMTFMPGVFLVLLWFMDADSTALLFTTTTGMIILSVVMIFNIIGHLWIRRILNVDV